jgi:hypothetical protein
MNALPLTGTSDLLTLLDPYLPDRFINERSPAQRQVQAGAHKSKFLSVLISCGVLGEGLANPVQDERVFGSKFFRVHGL